MEKKCKFCYKIFKPKRPNNIYCSDKCRGEIARERAYGNRYDYRKKLNRGQMGAVSELIICADLLKKGFYVFRAVSPSCFCDLIVTDGKKTLKIEVKSGRKTKNGVIHFQKNSSHLELIDIFAVAFKNSIKYFDTKFKPVKLSKLLS